MSLSEIHSRSSHSESEYSRHRYGRNFWLAKSQLNGYHFEDPFRAAAFAFYVLFTILLIGIFVTYIISRRSNAFTRSVLKWRKFGVAVSFALLYLIWVDIVALLTQLQAEVENVFYIINIIMETSFYIAEVWLLATILSLAYALFSSRENGRVPRLVIVTLLLPVALFISLSAVNICLIVRRYESYGTQLNEPYDYLILVVTRLEYAFDIILLSASVIILIGSVKGMLDARHTQRSIPAASRFVWIVVLPFLIRRLFIAIIEGYLLFGQGSLESIGINLALTVVSGFLLFACFLGIILTAKKADAVPPTHNWRSEQQEQITSIGYGPIVDQENSHHQQFHGSQNRLTYTTDQRTQAQYAPRSPVQDMSLVDSSQMGHNQYSRLYNS